MILYLRRDAAFASNMGDSTSPPPPLQLIVTLLIGAGAKVDLARTVDGATPLYIAAANGNGEIVTLLIRAGANVDLALNDGQSPLFAASEEGHAAIAELLIQAGARVNSRVVDPSPIDPNCSGLTALGIARKNGCDGVVAVLLQHGAEE